MSPKQRIQYIISTASSSLVTFIIKEHIFNLIGVFGYIVPVGVGVFTYMGFNILLDKSNQISWLRRKLNHNSIFEGHWIQEISKDETSYISVFSIFYNKEDEYFELEGISIETSQIELAQLDNITLHSTWESTDLLFDRPKRELRYLYQSIIERETEVSNKSEYGRKIIGLCTVKFAQDWQDGNGYLVEGSSTSKHDYLKFKFNRIDDTEFQKIYEKENSYTKTRKMLAVNYYKERSSR